MNENELLRMQADIVHLKTALVLLAKDLERIDPLISQFAAGSERAYSMALNSPSMDEKFLNALDLTREMFLALLQSVREQQDSR